MTIDELFSMPIVQMKQWLEENYRDPKGEYKTENYWYCDLKETFGVEFPEGSGWRIIPIKSGYSNGNESVLEKIKSYSHEHLYFGVTKISKYGECVSYILIGSFIYDQAKSTRWVNKWKFELSKILYNNDSGFCQVYIDGPDIVNKSKISVYYEHDKPNEYGDRWLNKYEFLDKYPSILYKVTPVVGGVKKNKHSINEFNIKFEEFAKNVLNVGNKAYYDNLDIIKDPEFKQKCDSVKISPEDVFNIWLACYVENQDISFDDIIGMIKLSQSKENLIKEYVSKCKCLELTKDYNGKYSCIKTGFYYSAYQAALLYGRSNFTNTVGFLGYLKDLNKTRTLYRSLDKYKDTISKSKKDYKDRFTNIAKDFEKEVESIYSKISKDLINSRDSYLNKSKNLYDYIHTTYPGVNDADVGIHEDLPNILDKLIEDFGKLSTKLMKLVDPSYKRNNTTESSKKRKETDSDFKEHCKLMFDASPDLKRILYFSVHKCYDAPYDLCNCDDVLDIPDESIYEYEEKYGQGSFNIWAEKFYTLAPFYENWKDFGDNLYPGCSNNSYINRDLEYEEEDNVE